METIKEVLSSVKIAVLAPCLKLTVSSGAAEPLLIGSPEQVPLENIARLIEDAVLTRFSTVSLLDEGTVVTQGAGGAEAIFPQLKETMGQVQEEVKARLIAMMHGGGGDGGGGGASAAPSPPPSPQPQPAAFAAAGAAPGGALHGSRSGGGLSRGLPSRGSPPFAVAPRPITVGGGARHPPGHGGGAR